MRNLRKASSHLSKLHKTSRSEGEKIGRAFRSGIKYFFDNFEECGHTMNIGFCRFVFRYDEMIYDQANLVYDARGLRSMDYWREQLGGEKVYKQWGKKGSVYINGNYRDLNELIDNAKKFENNYNSTEYDKTLRSMYKSKNNEEGQLLKSKLDGILFDGVERFAIQEFDYGLFFSWLKELGLGERLLRQPTPFPFPYDYMDEQEFQKFISNRYGKKSIVYGAISRRNS